jgi:hypothetical protein
MEKSTKLIIAAIGLGGLGYFLYKKGLFSNANSKTTLVTSIPTPTPTPTPTPKPTPTIPIVVKDPIIGTPVQVKVEDPIYNDSYYQAIVYPTNNDTYGGLKKPNDYMINVMPQQDYWSQGYSNSYNLDYKLGIDENYRYK